MANYFSFISTHIDEERDDFYHNTQLKEKRLSIGWGEINPLNKSEPEIKRIIEEFYPEYKGTNNPDNASKSLSMFSNLYPGDIVFVRGRAKILDVVVINGIPVFDRTGHYDGDYYLKVSFVPLFESKLTILETRLITEDIYNDVLFAEGRTIVIRKLNETVAIKLFKTIFDHT
ncbi:MAG: hypothetical protein FVQ80_13390 [Planctomycetes bacterium]|nr:hypothetical protein [Planctomycetota bacterium]